MTRIKLSRRNLLAAGSMCAGRSGGIGRGSNRARIDRAEHDK
jgi:hypothetical protein